MNRKYLVLLFLLVILISSGTSAITSLDITNIYPDTSIRETGTTTVIRIEADSNTVTTTELWVEKPDGTITQIGSNEITARSGNPRETSIRIQGSIFDQYGNYNLIANETNNGLSQSVDSEIAPLPDISVSVPNLVYSNEEVEDIQIIVRTQTGKNIPLDEINPGNATIYRIDDNSSTDKVEKTQVKTVKLVADNQTLNLESSIPVKELETGDYEVIGRFNITSCSSCKDYSSVASSTFLIRQGFDRLIYQDKWSSYTAEDVLNNQADIESEVDNNNVDIESVNSTVNSFGSNDRFLTTKIYRISVLILLGMIFLLIAYFSRR